MYVRKKDRPLRRIISLLFYRNSLRMPCQFYHPFALPGKLEGFAGKNATELLEIANKDLTLWLIQGQSTR